MRLEIRELSHRFAVGAGGLERVSLTLQSGEFAVLSGPNGSGKSLLLRHLFGLEKPDSGGITVDGRPLGQGLSGTRKRLGLVFQEPEHQILGLTVEEDVAFSPKSAGSPPIGYRDLVRAALRTCGLEGMERRLTATLSGGEKRRLAVAGVLVAQPELIALDEPFNDLDWDGASELLRILLRLYRQGTGILIVTHDLEKCLAHAGRLIVMQSGRVVRDGSPVALWPDLPSLGLRRPAGACERLAELSWLKPEHKELD